MERYWEIDFARGIAVLMMIAFHFIFDLFFFRGFDVNIFSGFWMYFARATAGLFILVFGISLTISYSRRKNFRRFLERAVQLAVLAVIITVFTLVLFPQETIWFGVLHFFAVSLLISIPFVKYRKLAFLFPLFLRVKLSTSSSIQG